MDVNKLKECLTKAGKQELGIPILLPSFADAVFSIAQWALEGSPIEGRQVWFIVGNAKQLRDELPSHLRNRILPLHPSLLNLIMKRQPYDSLLLPKHGFFYSDPNMTLSDFWKRRGTYVLLEDFQSEELQLWSWKSYQKPLRIFGIDHHHAVLWDAKQILRPLGIQLDFHWLCDGRPPINEAIPTTIPGFESSLDIYRTPIAKPLEEKTIRYILEKGYDAILTSHSLVTCFRFQELGLPHIHINSTRFGNDWIQEPENHTVLVKTLQTMFQHNRLQIIHNNEGDKQYFHQYFPSLQPYQEIMIPSLCESLIRLRKEIEKPLKILIWDTRQVLLKQDQSPFMKELFFKLKEKHGDAIDSQAILMAQTKNYLPEGYLDSYAAVIHIPYNVSTMSMFQQASANIPIWVPSKRLLAQLWVDSREPNELSWTVFSPGSEANASTLDHVRDPICIQRWLDTADFYNPTTLPLCFQFDSIEELVEKVLDTDYNSSIIKAEEQTQSRREDIIFSWEQIFMKLRNSLNK